MSMRCRAMMRLAGMQAWRSDRRALGIKMLNSRELSSNKAKMTYMV